MREKCLKATGVETACYRDRVGPTTVLEPLPALAKQKEKRKREAGGEEDRDAPPTKGEGQETLTNTQKRKKKTHTHFPFLTSKAQLSNNNPDTEAPKNEKLGWWLFVRALFVLFWCRTHLSQSSRTKRRKRREEKPLQELPPLTA